jgi:hypothetical protein
LFRSAAGLDLNFAGGAFSLNNTRTSNPAAIPGWSFSRTDTNGIATALDLAGNVIQFPSRTNLLLQSQTFDNASWTKQRATVTANATTAPDGSMTADKLVEDNTASNNHRTFQTVSTTGQPYAFSVFAKASERSWMYLRIDRAGATTPAAWFNLSAGTVGTVQTGLTASIQALPNGWYRCSVAVDTADAVNNSILLGLATADNSTNYNGDNTSGIFLWGAQLETGSTATDYIPTTTAAVTVVLPRITNRGILVEEARTNLATYSQEFDNAAWSKARATVTADTTVAPDGTTTADSLVEDTTSNSHPVYRTVASLANATAYTWSVFVAPLGRTSCNLAASNTAFGSPGNATFSLSGAGSVSASSGCTAVIQAVAGGFYRCSITLTTVSAGNGDVYVQPFNGGTSYLGNGLPALAIWGAQLELGAFATSPIITTGAAGTRGAEIPHIATSSVLYPFTLVADFTYEGADSSVSVNNRVAAAVTDGANDNRTQIYNLDGVGGAVTQVGGITQAAPSVGSTAAVGVTQRIAYRAQADNFIVARNGTLSAADTSGSVPSVTSLVSIGKGATGSPLNGYVQRVRVFPFAAPNAQLQALTAP